MRSQASQLSFGAQIADDLKQARTGSTISAVSAPSPHICIQRKCLAGTAGSGDAIRVSAMTFGSLQFFELQLELLAGEPSEEHALGLIDQQLHHSILVALPAHVELSGLSESVPLDACGHKKRLLTLEPSEPEHSTRETLRL
jgi:hypothetical protein